MAAKLDEQKSAATDFNDEVKKDKLFIFALALVLLFMHFSYDSIYEIRAGVIDIKFKESDKTASIISVLIFGLYGSLLYTAIRWGTLVVEQRTVFGRDSLADLKRRTSGLKDLVSALTIALNSAEQQAMWYPVRLLQVLEQRREYLPNISGEVDRALEFIKNNPRNNMGRLPSGFDEGLSRAISNSQRYIDDECFIRLAVENFKPAYMEMPQVVVAEFISKLRKEQRLVKVFENANFWRIWVLDTAVTGILASSTLAYVGVKDGMRIVQHVWNLL